MIWSKTVQNWCCELFFNWWLFEKFQNKFSLEFWISSQLKYQALEGFSISFLDTNPRTHNIISFYFWPTMTVLIIDQFMKSCMQWLSYLAVYVLIYTSESGLWKIDDICEKVD